MKYSNGGWLIKDGFNVDYAVHVYDVRYTENSLYLYAPFNFTGHKGHSLDGGMFTIEITSPLEDVISVKMYHHKGSAQKKAAFEINHQQPHVTITENENMYIFSSGKSSVEIAKGEQLSMIYKRDGEVLTESSPRSKAYIKDDTGQIHVSEQLSIGVGEYIYGLGERFTAFVKNGQTVDIWNEDGGTGTEQTYKNIPFYISNKGYGIFVNTPEKVSFEIGSEKVSKVQFSQPGESMEYFFMAGDNMKKVLTLYTTLTGKPSLPPAWSFGLWLSTSFLTDYDEETVNTFVDGMFERDIPLDVFHFDCLWMREFEWCNFTWDERMFPEPEKMLRRLKDKGLKISLWINPYVGQKSPLFDEGMTNGYFLKRPNGDVWQWDKWQAGLAIVDFTNPDAVAWYRGKLKALLDMGVDSFKTDFGERIPTDCVYHDGSSPESMHNYYAYLYNQVVFDLLKEERGEQEAVLFARSATTGSQKFPVHWGGDCTSDYPSMAESLRAGLSFGMSGFGFWSHDIGGFEAGCTPDLYKRWTQFGLLSSHSRYHGSWEYKVPWLYGEEAVDVTRKFTKLKLSLMPYIMKQAQVSVNQGIPMMRAMVLEFPEDRNSHNLDQQYMFGENLLVAPIFNDRGVAEFYVPEGRWTNFLTNDIHEGGKWYKEDYDYLTMPLLVKPNSLIVTGPNSEGAAYDYAKQVVIHAFEIDQKATAEVTDQQGKTVGSISVKRLEEGGYCVQTTGLGEASIVFRNEQLSSGESCAEGTLIKLTGTEQVIR